MIARHLMIFGRVQGVWYRAWTVDAARMLNLTGWVRNRTDGCVEALVQGDAQAVETLIRQAHEGPDSAVVARVDVREVPVEPMDGFAKRPTL